MPFTWSDDAWNDYVWWQSQDRKTLKRINLLLKDREYCRKRYTVPLRTQLIAPIREGNSMKQNRVAFNFAPCKL